MRIFYVDDSGNESLTTFTAISVPADRWSAALRSWLTWRRSLRDLHGVDVQYRLHATDWVAGRGRPAVHPRSALNRSKPMRWEAYVAALVTLRVTPGLQVLTVARPGSDRRSAYRVLMRWIDDLLTADRAHGLVVLDGEGAELRTMHAELDSVSRAIVEDPWKRDARESQWLQAADLVAYAAFQHIARRADRAFMWHWYERCLGERIVRDADAPLGVRGLAADDA
jgi:hypothetical protein